MTVRVITPVDMTKFGPLPERPHPRAVVPIPRIAVIVDIKADTCAALAANGPDSPEGRNWQGLADELRDVVWMLRAVQPQPEVAHEKAVATANALAQWLNENRIPPQTLHPVYNAWVLLCDFIARSQQ
jgi:hypothetical protein